MACSSGIHLKRDASRVPFFACSTLLVSTLLYSTLLYSTLLITLASARAVVSTANANAIPKKQKNGTKKRGPEGPREGDGYRSALFPGCVSAH